MRRVYFLFSLFCFFFFFFFSSRRRHTRYIGDWSSDVCSSDLSGKDFHYPINFGASYRAFPWLDVGLSLMHGRIVSLRVSTLINAAAENWQARDRKSVV